MFEQWFKFWRDWMFWWLPGGDTPGEKQPDTQPEQPAKQQPSSPKEASGQTAASSKSTVAASSSTPERGRDDLTEIKGIGPAIQRKLEAVGVKSFADLAAADPGELAEKIASRPVTAERVRAWIAEARKRA